MKKIIILSIALLFSELAVADPVRILTNEIYINAAARHIKQNGKIKVQYDFELKNNSARLINRIEIGQKSLTSSEAAIFVKADSPDGPFENFEYIAPFNWHANDMRSEESYNNLLFWYIPTPAGSAKPIQPYSVTKNIGVIGLKKYATLFSTYASINDDDSNQEIIKVVKIFKIDGVLPTGNISTLIVKNTNKKNCFDINISITAKDNYDPLPEIAFDSIQDITTSSTGAVVSPFGAGYALNVPNDATKGVYPTIITLAADAKVAKKYRIKYKITDASDNQTTVSTVVTIPKQ